MAHGFTLKIHQTHHTIADFEKIQEYILEVLDNPTKGLHLFPELYLTGYPLQDLLLQQSFIEKYKIMLEQINEHSLGLKLDESKALLLGGLNYTFDEKGLPLKIENVIFELIPGKSLKKIYTKRLLPNYDIFDEKKYFTPGDECGVWKFQDKNIALMICEDMWPSNAHPLDPAYDIQLLLQKKKLDLDLIINLSASPYHLGKGEKRIKRGSEISGSLGAPFVYINRVGGEDEILFDGRSFLVNEDELIWEGKLFEADISELPLPDKKAPKYKLDDTSVLENTWESLFNPQLIKSGASHPILKPLDDVDCARTLAALKFGIREYARKSGINKFLVALSGGIDSTLVLTIVKLCLEEGQELEALFMPGYYTVPASFDLSEKLCKNLNIPLKILPIKFLHTSIRNAFNDSLSTPLEGLADENIQSRLRGALLYSRSNQAGSLVFNTSNKSELAVGYSTQYGDSVGALSVLGDLFKSEVFNLAGYINKKYNNLIPEEILLRPPSAELREDQFDEQTLPAYEILDGILEGLLSYRLSPKNLITLGFPREDVEKTFNLYQKVEFKRFQFCPIIKVKPKSFGFGYRIPICKERF
ncbi:MAG: NAD(+) synthase [Epsilonproteobacteria bacterium]|nr:MAG: NAD(+) synthase [Campylobacterota bacterium]RLA67630.1 MAG: NAD(+) synthase [Campylobacterota bacterium]